jgi:hypothetical protein
MNTTRLLTALAALILVSAVGATSAYGHAERRSYYPNHKLGSVPEYKRSGQTVPITVSWREQQESPARVDYGTGSLPLPRAEAGAHS